MPAAWEIKAQRENACFLSILIPPDHTVSFPFMRQFRHIELPPGSDILPIKGFPWGPARNYAAKTALDHGRHLCFLDSDVRVEPDAFMKLLATGLELVGGLYYQKVYPYLPVMFNMGKNEKGEFISTPITNWNPGDIVPATFVPSGLTVYRHSLLQKLFARFPSPFTWGHDLTPVLEPDGTQAPKFCVPDGQEVFGGSLIETVEKNEILFDGEGGSSTVIDTYQKPYDGSILTIHPASLRIPFKVTPEHKVLIGVRGAFGRERAIHPLWLQAKDIKPGMALCFPILQTKHESMLDMAKYIPEFAEIDEIADTNGRLKRFLPITIDLMEFCGWYVAEGSASEASRTDLRFSLGPHERNVAVYLRQQMRRTFGLENGTILKGAHALILRFGTRVLHNLFRSWFGHNAQEKRIPRWILEQPPEMIAAFLKGLWAGDGFQTYVGTKKVSLLGFRTSSYTLALQVAALLIKLGIRPCVRPYRQHKTSFSRNLIYHVAVQSYDCQYLANILGIQLQNGTPSEKATNRSVLNDKGFWFRIDKITSDHYHGIVRDLTLTPTHSFILGPAVVSNSEDFSCSWKATQVGVQPYIATGIFGLHEVIGVVGPRWKMPMPSPDSLHGICGTVDETQGSA